MLPLLVVTALALDAPDFAACEAPPWPTSRDDMDLQIRDHPLGDFDGHPARLRVCAEYSGFGYWRLMAVLWIDGQRGGLSTSHLDLQMTACVGSTTDRSGDTVILETTHCAYSDEPDAPPSRTRTRLRWHDEPPRFERR